MSILQASQINLCGNKETIGYITFIIIATNP